MKDTFIKLLKDVDLNEPILIEALPGIGHVGKLVAEHIIHELHAENLQNYIHHHSLHRYL